MKTQFIRLEQINEDKFVYYYTEINENCTEGNTAMIFLFNS